VRRTVHRHLGKVVAGAAIAVAGTAVMVAITLPGTAGADESGGTGKAAGSASNRRRTGQGAAPGVVQQAPAEGEKGKGRDPLTDDEMKRVERIAVNQQLLNSSENVDGKRGPQRLDVELANPGPSELDNPNAPRRADVTFYDYKDDTVVTKTVNLDTGKVEQTGTQHGVQPPASHAEDVEAAELLLARPAGRGPEGRLQGRHRQRTHLARPAVADRHGLQGHSGTAVRRPRPVRRAPVRAALPEGQERAVDRRP
jgi:hypothetical protein